MAQPRATAIYRSASESSTRTRTRVVSVFIAVKLSPDQENEPPVDV